MANTDIYFNLVNGVSHLQDARNNEVGVIVLDYQDTLTIHVGSGFGDATTSISDVSIYQWTNGAKGALVGGWPENSAFGDLSFTESGNNVVIEDVDQRTVDDDYGYSVSVTAVKGGSPTVYTADPELQIKRKRPKRGDAATPSARPVEPEANP